MLEVYLLRHGRTQANKGHLLQGRGSNLPLDQTGLEQARAVGSWLSEQGIRFDRVISSPLVRARQTAALAAGMDEDVIETSDLLLEMDYGSWEGFDMQRHDPALAAFFADFVHAPTPPGMEPLVHVTERARTFLASLGPNDGRVLVSTHAILLKGALEALDPSAQGAWWSRYVGNCWLYRSTLADGRLQPARHVWPTD